ncbi:hypothetical protein SALB_08529 [Streptomyces noursei]|uniref:Uncharacterized protein n=1 Tax=Streptomyces noursei TaxID=1971 RepID=A0A401RDL6_STRNR|nr:hypothetical protein SALB_08529 [Streptomyces noursei]
MPGRGRRSATSPGTGDFLGVRPGRLRGVVGVARLRTAHPVEQHRAVAHRAADAALHGQAVEHLVEVGPPGDPAAGGLQPEEAVVRGGDADRAGGVGGVRERDHPGGDGRARSPAGSARAPLRVPGVAGGAVQDGFRRVAVGHLRCRGAPERHEAGAAEAPHQGGVGSGDVAGGEAAAQFRAPAGHGDPDVLDQERDSGQRCAAGGGRVVGRPGLHDGVELRIDRPCRLACGCFDFAGGHLATGHQLREPDPVELHVLGNSHCHSQRKKRYR